MSGRRFPPSSYAPIVAILSLLAIIVEAYGHNDGSGCYTSIVSFGDSLADTGNLVRIASQSHPPHFAFPPYGETFFGYPTGRCSDGRLVVDFIAEALGLPLLPPNFADQEESFGDFQKGVNFAVAGATALDVSFFRERGLENPFSNSTLGVQLGLFKQLLPSLCGSDSGKNIREIREYVPFIVNEIASAINELINMGAVTILVPGNLPIGCLPVYLTSFETSDQSQYDSHTGCLKWLNEFAEYHNVRLQTKLDEIRKLWPNVRIVYADYYHAALRFFHSPTQFGFDGNGEVLKACCGSDGPYNINPSVSCGDPGANLCDDPSMYVSWDGIHLTEAAYRWLFNSLFEDRYTVPAFRLSCPNAARKGNVLSPSLSTGKIWRLFFSS
ncbi:hypothetical protein MLD38_019301 [Melastoma candidum]|uniref:Uncharacterized protein n=1 Tax=Melastoma candidum TaxID=119954 RepID=A0ACB9QWH9_9MYRT|nr:hypothetical protein MLD38_019301 [Melastoma candidum]